MLGFAILFLGIVSRLVFHVPNFTPVIALALFGGFYLKKKHALYVPLLLMMISDIFIGLHSIIFFTWGSILLISAVGIKTRKNKSYKNVFGASLLSAFLFFMITNFGSWIVMYPHTLDGLAKCYFLAIPFFRSTLLGTLVYSAVLFGLYELIALKVRNTKFAEAILTK